MSDQCLLYPQWRTSPSDVVIEKTKANFACRARTRKTLTLPGPPALKLKTQLRRLCHPLNFFYCSSSNQPDGMRCKTSRSLLPPP